MSYAEPSQIATYIRNDIKVFLKKLGTTSADVLINKTQTNIIEITRVCDHLVAILDNLEEDAKQLKDSKYLKSLEKTGMKRIDNKPWVQNVTMLKNRLTINLMFAVHADFASYQMVVYATIFIRAYFIAVLSILSQLKRIPKEHIDNLIRPATLIQNEESVSVSVPSDLLATRLDSLNSATRITATPNTSATIDTSIQSAQTKPFVRESSSIAFEKTKIKRGGGWFSNLFGSKSTTKESLGSSQVQTNPGNLQNIIKLGKESPSIAQGFMTQYAHSYEAYKISVQELEKMAMYVINLFESIINHTNKLVNFIFENTYNLEEVVKEFQLGESAKQTLILLSNVVQKNKSKQSEFYESIQEDIQIQHQFLINILNTFAEQVNEISAHNSLTVIDPSKAPATTTGTATVPGTR